MLMSSIKSALLTSIILICTGCANIDLGWLLQSYDDIQAAEAKNLQAKLDALLTRGEALEALRVIDSNDFSLAEIQQRYLQAFNLLLEQATNDFDHGELVSAGELYRQALNHYPHNESMRADITTSKEKIETMINLCADRLLDSGLLAYRNGRLEEAIEVWSKIRHFHPTYKPSQQAIETTRIQLKNLL